MELAQLSEAKLVRLAQEVIKRDQLGQLYSERLDFEFREIEKQGAWLYWLDLVKQSKKFSSNPNHMLLPWLLRMLVVPEGDSYRKPTAPERQAMDPVAHRPDLMVTTSHYKVINQLLQEHNCTLPADMVLDSDKPDIDLDCLPEARNVLKDYAMSTYRVDSDDPSIQQMGCVCSVGTWQTYKFRSALIDVYKAVGRDDKNFILGLTTNLPEWVDDLPDDGHSACKNLVNGKECKERHDRIRCPKCGAYDSADAPTKEKVIHVNKEMVEFYEKNSILVDDAVGLIGRIRSMGMHAGAIIIADRPLYGNLPLIRRMDKAGDNKQVDKNSEPQWISAWTEGRNTQLSKFGFIKWDILGLKNLKYIHNCCRLIYKNTGGRISFGDNMEGWEFSDPLAQLADYDLPGYAGWYLQDGVKHMISLNDPAALGLANRSLTDGVFQFDTQLAKETLRHGVRNFNDLLLLNAMGHPGPMDSIPEAMENRDSTSGEWQRKLAEQHPAFLEILESTYGVICFQEQLAAIWQRIGGFTSTEAQEARKAVSKKWRHLLDPIRAKWVKGAGNKIGTELATWWWDERMESFGRYAFNKSHAVAYCLMAFKCLYLKAHFPAEWWASTLSYCHSDKLVRYVGIAKYESNLEGIKPVKFGALNIDDLEVSFDVDGQTINQGLIGIKGIGIKTATVLEKVSASLRKAANLRRDSGFDSIEAFINQMAEAMTKLKADDAGKPITEIKLQKLTKRVMERLIKLGSFQELAGHGNRRALWYWYLYTYFKGDESRSDLVPDPKDRTKLKPLNMKQLRKEVDAWRLANSEWNSDAAIQAERARQLRVYQLANPKRTVVPAKIRNWRPTMQPPTIAEFAELYSDYSAQEVLDMEKRYVGYYLSNPMARFARGDGDWTIKRVRDMETNVFDGFVTQIERGKTKTKKDAAGQEIGSKKMSRMLVSDGTDEIMVFVWQEDCEKYEHLLIEAEQRLSREGKKTSHELGVRVYVKYDDLRRSCSVKSGGRYNKNMGVPSISKLALAGQATVDEPEMAGAYAAI